MYPNKFPVWFTRKIINSIEYRKNLRKKKYKLERESENSCSNDTDYKNVECKSLRDKCKKLKTIIRGKTKLARANYLNNI